MRKQFFQFLSRFIYRYNGLILLLSVIITLLMILASSNLKLKTRISDMLPKGIPQVEEFDSIIRDFSSVSTVMITIENSEKDLEKMKDGAEKLAALLIDLKLEILKEDQNLSLKDKIKLWFSGGHVSGLIYDTISLVKRVDYKADHDFISNHGMMIQKTKDLINYIEIYNDLSLTGLLKNMNENFEKEYIADTEKINDINGEEDAVQGLETIKRFIIQLNQFRKDRNREKAEKAAKELLTGPEYFISPDNTMLLMLLQPAVSMNDFELALDLAYQIEEALNQVRRELPDLEIGRTGVIMMQMDENEALKKDFQWPSLFALLIILFLLVSSFRSWKKPIYSVLTLILSIIWVSGILALTTEYLNAMSAAFGLILVGLGIDFGIHYISGFHEGREKGLKNENILIYMYEKVGSGVITGATTTAMVFFSLYFTGFKAFSQLGITIGLGILVTLLGMMVLLPALMIRDYLNNSLFNRIFQLAPFKFFKNREKNKPKKEFLRYYFQFFQFRFLYYIGCKLKNRYLSGSILFFSIVILIFCISISRKIGFQYDMLEMEPEGINSVITQDKILDKYEMAPDFALLKAGSLEECRMLVEELKKMGNRTSLIGRIDAITQFIPPDSVQIDNALFIEEFVRNLKMKSHNVSFGKTELELIKIELERLHNNIVEIGELSITSKGLKNKIIKKCDQIVGKKDENSLILKFRDSLSEEDTLFYQEFQKISIPVLKKKLIKMASTDFVTLKTLPEEIKKRYLNPAKEEYLITIYPKNNIWEQRSLEKFTEKTYEISDKITGTPIITLLFIELTKEKGRLAIILGLAAIFILLLIDFRSIKYSILAMLPLSFGFFMMLGFMVLLDMKFDYSNFMALPLILGIGIDDGVHILHRYREEGKGSIPHVIQHTGKAILLTSLTTMIGFGSMGLASHRGIAGLGILLFIGVGTCFVSSAFILPSILIFFEKWMKNNSGG